jgi:RNA polymerase sigma-70 factor (ECF subfamily)
MQGNMTTAEQETMWVLRASAGDREALDALLRSVQGPLYRYVSSLISNSQTAEDVLQEVFFLIYRKLAWLRDPELFRPWAFRIATRECFKHLKREKQRGSQISDPGVLDSMAADTGPDEITADLAARLPGLVATLSPASRAVILLHYFSEMTIDEVASVLAISPGTVKSRLAYGLARLRECMASEQSAPGEPE